jgi:hypothetical protein
VTAADLSTGASGAAARADAGAALAHVTRVLASHAAPQLPSWLVSRLDQALAAEAAGLRRDSR